MGFTNRQDRKTPDIILSKGIDFFKGVAIFLYFSLSTSVDKSYPTRKVRIMVGTAREIITWLYDQPKGIRYEIKEKKNKRSLDSNAYFHVLCDELRLALGISMAACKNHLIADYGQIEYVDGEPMIYKTNAPEDYMMELETIHTKCIKVSEENGKSVYFYRVYRGSHSYDTKEMATLIQGTISECQECGIETATPEELKKMEERWEMRHA